MAIEGSFPLHGVQGLILKKIKKTVGNKTIILNTVKDIGSQTDEVGRQ